VVGAVMGLNYRNQAAEQAGLKSQILSTNQKIAAVPLADLKQKEMALTAQQKKIDTQISLVKSSLTHPVSYIDITDTLYALAKDSNVELLKVASAGAADQDLSKLPFSAIPLTVQVKGNVSDILQFTKGLTEKFSLSIVKPVQIDVPPSGPGITIPRTWSLESGTLPAGLQLDPLTGTISGIPDTLGESSFTVKAEFGDKTSATQDLSITVEPHKITTGSVANAEINIPYSQTLSASGVVPDSSEVSTQGTSPTATITLNILSSKES
jgi:hypothetical protein